MITATRDDIVRANAVFNQIPDNALPPRAAYRVGRLIAKFGAVLRDLEEKKKAIILEHGGTEKAGAVILYDPRSRTEEETEEAHTKRLRDIGDDDAFKKDVADYIANVGKISDKIAELLMEDVQIDYDPIPLSMLEVSEADPEDKARTRKRALIGPGGMAAAMAFIAED